MSAGPRHRGKGYRAERIEKMNEFSREEMLIGTDGMEVLARSQVAVFGLGGVGSHAAEALARGGVGKLFLADHDTVSLTNLNRQIIALHSTVGRGKAQVMKERIRDICPETEVTLCETFVLPENLAEVMSQAGPVDFILDAIDTVSSKLALAAYAKEHSIPIISAMGTGNKLYPELFRISDISQTRVCPLCRVMRRELKSRNLDRLTVCWSPEQPIRPSAAAEGDKTKMRATPGSVSFVPPVAGLLMAGYVIRRLCGLEADISR